MKDMYCTLCPRECKADRRKECGFCGAGERPTVAKAMLHRWEEPGICYQNGSGAVFFSGCQLKCVFCQNHKISQKAIGKAMNSDELSALFFRLEEAGACNIDLISPTPYIKELLPALREAKRLGLSIPIVYNSGGYEKTETLKMLSGSIDIYLPDFKFFSSSLSSRYASAPDYAARCLDAIKEMYAQVGPPLWDGEQLKSGVIVRHLILPGNSRDSVEVLRLLKQHFPRDGIVLSLLRQYTPMHLSKDFPEIARPITSLEYKRVLNAAEEYGFSYIYTQSKESVGEGFVPDFSVFFNENN